MGSPAYMDRLPWSEVAVLRYTSCMGWPCGRISSISLAGILGVVGMGCPDAACRAGGEAKARERMVREQIKARGVKDPRVLRAMGKVERHRFVSAALRDYAYADRPLPIGHRQTISQPFIVASMTEALNPRPGDRVLEIGTGSGYQAAILAEVVKEVYSIEILPALAKDAKALLGKLGYRNIHVKLGDGYAGWPERQPFDGILVTAAPPDVPKPLLGQLRVGGRLVMPVGTRRQELVRITRTAKGFKRERLYGVRFVPMTGEAQRRSKP